MLNPPKTITTVCPSVELDLPIRMQCASCGLELSWDHDYGYSPRIEIFRVEACTRCKTPDQARIDDLLEKIEEVVCA